MGKKSGSGTWIIFPIFWVQIQKFFDADPGWKKIRIRHGRNSDPGSGINIPTTLDMSLSGPLVQDGDDFVKPLHSFNYFAC
jgi:hypothetical protein